MLIQIDKLKRRPRQVKIEEPAGDFSVLRELISQGSVAFNSVIHGSLTATWAGDVIEVSGRLGATVTLPCGRCLSPVTSDLAADVLLCYSGKQEDDLQDVEELEIRSDEMGLIGYTGPEIDLRPDLEQEIIMALPQQVLCKESCQGLCPVCGNNLNQKVCACEKPVFHAGLAALKNFKVEQ